MKFLMLMIIVFVSRAQVGYAAEAQVASVQVGILDQFGLDFLGEGTAFVLPLFEKRNGNWSPLTSTKPVMEWKIAFDGRSLGALTSKPAKKNPLSDMSNLQDPQGVIAHPDKPLRKTADGRPIYRPLVLVNGDNFKDPDQWKRFDLPASDLKKILAAFRKQYPKVKNCVAEGKPEKIWKFPTSALRTMKAYRSNKGNILAQVELRDYKCGEVPDDYFRPQYFALPAKSDAIFMSTSIELIDAGDYDGDGQSEILFFDSSHGGDDGNSDGYSLWGPNFKKLAERVWYYH